MTLTGILTDFDGNDVKIDDKLYTLTDPAAKWCREKLKKGQRVEAQFTDGKISKIYAAKQPANDTQSQADIKAEQDAYNAKAAKAGFGQPTESKQEDKNTPCTSSNPPAKPDTELKTVIGQIQNANPEKRALAVKDVDGVIHPFYWLPAMDSAFAHLKQWWFVKVTAEQMGDDYRAISQTKADRPNGWKSAGGFGGRGNYQPRNEKPMAYESAFKSCAELVRDTDFPGVAYADRVREVKKAADEIAKWIIADGGA